LLYLWNVNSISIVFKEQKFESIIIFWQNWKVSRDGEYKQCRRLYGETHFRT